MSPSPQPPHGQANGVSTTVGRTISSVVLVLFFVVLGLALLSGPATAELAVFSGSSGTPDLPVAEQGTTADPVTVHKYAAVDSSMTEENEAAVPSTGAWVGSEGVYAVGLDDGQATDQPESAQTITGPLDEPRAVQNEPTAQPDPLVPDHSDFDLTATSEAASNDPHASTGAASNFQGERYERSWGLDPSAPVSPATIGGIAFGFLLGAGAFAVARPVGIRAEPPVSGGVDDGHRETDSAGADLEGDDFVPDEAIVEGILLSQDGRMKQSAIVNMTDWSKAKVSRVLSAMADEGRVVKIRIGRENLICLDGWEPDAAKGPHPT